MYQPLLTQGYLILVLLILTLFRCFPDNWNIKYFTKIPYNPKSQAIIECTHFKITDQLIKQKSENRGSELSSNIFRVCFIYSKLSEFYPWLWFATSCVTLGTRIWPFSAAWYNFQIGTWNSLVSLLKWGQEYSCISADYWQTLRPSQLLCGQNLTHLHDVSRPQAMTLRVHRPLSWQGLQQPIHGACHLINSQGLVQSLDNFFFTMLGILTLQYVFLWFRGMNIGLTYLTTSAQTLNLDGQATRNFPFYRKQKSYIYCSASPPYFHGSTRMS